MRENMKADRLGKCLLTALAVLLVSPALADEPAAAATGPGSPGAGSPAAAATPAPPAAVNAARMPSYPVWPGGAYPVMRPPLQPMPYFVPYYPGRAGGFFMPAPMPMMMPGMPAPRTWVPVIMIPAAVAPGVTGPTVDYGPVADTPVVELPLPEAPGTEPQGEPEPSSTTSEPKGESGASVSPEAPPVAAIEPVMAQPPAETARVDSAAALPASEAVAWPEPRVDYGPVAATPVVDLLALEKQLSDPPIRATTRTRSRATPTASAALVAKKKRICWENGIVAPCR